MKKYANCLGILFDQPEVIALAPERPRIRKVGGNFFESVPEGGDLYTLKWVIHDWEEPKALAILRNVRNLSEPAPAAAVADVAETTRDVAPAEGRTGKQASRQESAETGEERR